MSKSAFKRESLDQLCTVPTDIIDTPFFERRGRPYDRQRPRPLPAERVATAITAAVTADRRVVYVPGWLRFPAWLHGAAPGTFGRLARRFG